MKKQISEKDYQNDFQTKSETSCRSITMSLRHTYDILISPLPNPETNKGTRL